MRVIRVSLSRVCSGFRHINIGSRFQAEIPELQDRSLAGVDEHVASLVWKPWGDMTTNPETQDRGVRGLGWVSGGLPPATCNGFTSPFPT